MREEFRITTHDLKSFLSWLENFYPALYKKYFEQSEVLDYGYVIGRFVDGIGFGQEKSTFQQLQYYIVNNEDMHDWWLL